MTDQELELRLRAWYRGEVADAESAPVALRTRLPAIPRAPARPSRLLGWRRTVTLLVAAMLLIGGAVVTGSWLVRLPSIAPTLPGPSPSISSGPTAVTPSSEAAWTVTDDLLPRRFPDGTGIIDSATLLLDGRVLVVEAGRSEQRFASAELYDPTGRRWMVTGSPANIQASNPATLLLDGRVLMVETGVGEQGVARAELYDPTTGRWSAANDLVQTRNPDTATLLRDGRVLVVGSSDADGHTPSAEIYDPGNGQWSTTGTLTEARDLDTATLLPDGTVLVAGGRGPGGTEETASAELYDPSTGHWTATGDMVAARHGHTATLLADGTVLVAGGSLDDARDVELYDPGTGAWTATGKMISARRGRHDSVSEGHTATSLLDGGVLVAGGAPNGRCDLKAAELYDPNTGEWTSTTPMVSFRGNHAATLLPSGDVLVVSGMAGTSPTCWPSPPTRTLAPELYHPATGALAR